MTPEELAALHPRLYHVTTPGAWDLIAKIGLLSTCALLETFGYDAEQSAKLTLRRRPGEVSIQNPLFGTAVLNDNIPLNEKKLTKSLDDGLTPSEWLRMLNERVFFWSSRKGLDTLLGARANSGRAREVLVFDTFALATAHWESIEICPINSGATGIMTTVRRGRATFSPIANIGYQAWRDQRGLKGRDVIKEVAVRGGVPDIARYLVARETVAR